MLEIEAVRQQFPALKEQYDGRPAVYLDNPGGTQVPIAVMAAISDYLTRRNANTHGLFATSKRTDAVIDEARRAAADLLGAGAGEIVFGPNMTSLAFQLSHSLLNELRPGDEIIVTRLDHDANIMPWIMMAERKGVTVHWADIEPEDCTLDMDHLESLLNSRTKLLAVGYASNASGSINDVKSIVEWAKANQTLTFVDAVQYAPHGFIDVKDLDCDFLACSAYKFFGPHVGILYGKREHLDRLQAFRVRPAGNAAPEKWETGTRNHEGLAGMTAAIDYLAELGSRYGRVSPSANRREKLQAAFDEIHTYEQMLLDRLLSGLEMINRMRVYGITDRANWSQRVATVSMRKEGTEPEQLAQALADENIFAWHGNFYAVALSETLGVESSGGLLRLGMVHYNTLEEVDRCLTVLERV